MSPPGAIISDIGDVWMSRQTQSVDVLLFRDLERDRWVDLIRRVDGQTVEARRTGRGASETATRGGVDRGSTVLGWDEEEDTLTAIVGATRVELEALRRAGATFDCRTLGLIVSENLFREKRRSLGRLVQGPCARKVKSTMFCFGCGTDLLMLALAASFSPPATSASPTSRSKRKIALT